MSAELDKEEEQKVADRKIVAERIEQIVARFGGTVEVDWQTETINIDISEKHKLECSIAVGEAVESYQRFERIRALEAAGFNCRGGEDDD